MQPPAPPPGWQPLLSRIPSMSSVLGFKVSYVYMYVYTYKYLNRSPGLNRFIDQLSVSDGRTSNLPSYKNTPHALWTIARIEGFRGLYAGFFPAVLGSTISWGLYFFFYSRAKQRYSKGREELTPGLHLASAAEAGALVCFCTNPLWLVKTRLQLQTPLHQNRPYSGLYDAVRTILKEEGLSALYKGLVPGLFLQVTHGAIQFTAYEELRKAVVAFRSKEREEEFSGIELLVRLALAWYNELRKYFSVCMRADVNSFFCSSIM
ncbi:Folate transporter 1, chloroplastic, variant 2 [Sarracenia purpurea var. burkii]